MTLSDLEWHFCWFWTFLILFINEYDTYWLRCLYTWLGKYAWSLIVTVFRKWRTIQGYAPINAVTYYVNVVVSKKLCRIHTLLLHTSNKKYHIAYRFLPSPMTSGDREGHLPVAGLIKCNSTNICATSCTVQLTRRVARSLGDSWASCRVGDRNGGFPEWRTLGMAGCYRRGQGHVSNFYIVDLENFATATRRYTGDIHNSSVVGLFMTPIGQWKRLDSVMVECTCLLHVVTL